MRRTYTRSDETFKVLSGHEGAIASEMECDPSYIFAIKNGKEPDRYPPFREIFRSACNAQNPPAEVWLHDLAAIYIRSRPFSIHASELSAKLLQKINDDAQALSVLVDSIKDGVIDKSECHEILAKLAKNEKTNDQIKTIVLARLGELTEKTR